MKILIMCEGPNELKVINMLLNIDLLIYAITEYRRTHTKHNSNEEHLFDLLK